MKLPFQVTKIYTTRFSEQDVLHFVQNRLDKKKGSLFSAPMYGGSIHGSVFKLFKRYKSENTSYPRIKGKIISSSPTTIEITISPQYFTILFFLLFPAVFIPAALFIDDWEINEVSRPPEIYERILLVLFAGGGPILWCYFVCIRPIKQTQKWIKQKLHLEEKVYNRI